MSTPEVAFSAAIADLAFDLKLSSSLILVKDAADLKASPARAPAGSKDKTIFAVTPEDDPLLRGTFINAGWRHRGTEAGDIFWRAF